MFSKSAPDRSLRWRVRTVRAVSAALLLASGALAQAELVVVANGQSGLEELSRAQLVNIYLGHSRELPNGTSASPVDLPFSAAEKAQFYRLLVNKDLDQIAAYWSRLVFAGNTQPPLQASSAGEALQFVATHKGGIAYLDRHLIDGRVKVVFSFP